MEEKIKLTWQDGDRAKAIYGQIVDEDVEAYTILTEDKVRFKIFKKFVISIVGGKNV
jgi:hypothetical protein